jgi:hypothetical protein
MSLYQIHCSINYIQENQFVVIIGNVVDFTICDIFLVILIK